MTSYATSFTVLAVFVVVILIIILGIYIATAIFLNKFNKLVYGKGTAMAWIPVFDVYLLGKLTINKAVGWVLVICVILTGSYSTTINGVKTTYALLPEEIGSIVSTIYGLAVLGLFIYAIIKYNKIKKEQNNSNSQYQQPVQQPVQQPIEQSVQQPIEQPVQQPVQQPIEQPVQQPIEQQNSNNNGQM